MQRLLCVVSTFTLCAIASVAADAEVLTFQLTNVYTDRGGQLTGQFTWAFNSGDFENGVGTFTSLDVPHTSHGIEDLIITIEPDQIEISLDGSYHDDGVDITLVLQQPFSVGAPAALDLTPTESRYSIGGNGFIEGHFIFGSVSLIVEQLIGDATGDGFVNVDDLDILLANWGENVDVGDWALGDLSGDGFVDGTDLDLVLNHWGNGTPPAGVIPEPMSLGIIVSAGALLLYRRRV